MRAGLVATIAAIVFMAAPATSRALTVVPANARIAANSPIPGVELIRDGCGRGWHRVGGYRNRYGHWVPSRCVPNRYY